ncbi:MAG: peptidoglycan DD-metalloendopeptidase family protein [Ornithinimicrobium sp.]
MDLPTTCIPTPITPISPRRSRGRLTGALLVTLSLSLTFTAPAVALDDIRDRMDEVEQQRGQTQQEADALDDSMDALGEDLDETSTELVAADQKLKQTNAEVDQAQIELATAEAELADAEADAERIETELALARANEEKIEASLQDNAEEQEDSREAVGAIARESYKTGGVGTLALTLDVISGEGDAVEEMAMARTVMRVQDNTLDRLATQQAEEVVEQDRLKGVRREIALLLAEAEANVLRKQDARDVADESKRALEALQTRQRTDKAALEKEKKNFEGQLAQAEGEADDLEAQLAKLAQEKHGLDIEEEAEKQRIAAEEARLRAETQERARQEAAAAARREAEAQEAAEREAQAQADAAAAASSQSNAAPAPQPAPTPAPAPAPQPAPAPAPAPSSGFLSAPSSAPVSSLFGFRTHPVLGIQRLHAGMDYAGACGSPILAAADGTIIGTPFTSGGGNKIIIDHGVHRGVNLTTTSAHMSSYAVRSGSVSRGQVIGYVGTSGLSTGCHLHFETRENGIAVDPRTWL